MGLRDQRTSTAPQGLLPFEYEATNESDQVTARAGLPLVLETVRALRIHESVLRHVDVRKRDAGFSEAEHIEALILLLAAGGDCLEDLSVLGADGGLLRLCDKEKLPSPDAARQFLLAFHDEELLWAARRRLPPGETALIAPESRPLWGLGLVVRDLVQRVQAAQACSSATVEGDATIIESHKREAQPHYEGGRGYQPVVAYWVEQDLCLADQFRDGNVPACKQPLDVVRRAFENVPADIPVRRFRGDSAFQETATLQWLNDPKNRIERFTVSADMEPSLRRLCEALRPEAWQLYEQRAEEVVFVSEVEYITGNWPKTAQPLGTLVLRIDAPQGEIFAERGPKYLSIVTNDFETDPTELVRWHYAKAGQIERVHDVLKNELGGGVLPCGAFGANAAWWRLNLLTYNVLSAMKRLALPPRFQDARPKRLRFALFTMPGRLAEHARKLRVRVAECLSTVTEILAARAALLRLALLPAPFA
jgi:hypothetical protein